MLLGIYITAQFTVNVARHEVSRKESLMGVKNNKNRMVIHTLNTRVYGGECMDKKYDDAQISIKASSYQIFAQQR